MISISKFCPYERVLTTFLSKHANARDITYVVLGKKFKFKDVSFYDNALGISVKNRLVALVSGFDANITYSEDGIVYKKSIRVTPKLFTNEPSYENYEFEGKVVVNGVENGTPVCYPEALITDVSLNQDGAAKTDFGCRPAFCYVIVSESNTDIVVYGPGRISACKSLGTIAIRDKNLDLFEEGELQISAEPMEEEEVIAPTSSKNVRLRFTYGDAESKFVFGQDPFVFDGVSLKGDLLDKVVRTIVYYEAVVNHVLPYKPSVFFDEETGIITMPLIKDPYFTCNEDFQSFYRNFVVGNEVVDNILSNVIINDTGIYLVSNGKVGKLMAAGSKACYAFSSIFFLNMKNCQYLSNFFLTLSSLLDNGNYQIVDGVIEGSFSNKPEYDISVSTFRGKVHLKGRRVLVEDIKHYNGPVLAGIETTRNSNPEGPDHYVIAFAEDGILRCVYDPLLRNPIERGSDISDQLNEPTNVYFVFEDTNK